MPFFTLFRLQVVRTCFRSLAEFLYDAKDFGHSGISPKEMRNRASGSTTKFAASTPTQSFVGQVFSCEDSCERAFNLIFIISWKCLEYLYKIKELK